MSQRSFLGGLDSFRPAGIADDPGVLTAALDPTGGAIADSAGALAVATNEALTCAGTTRTMCILDGTVSNLPRLAGTLGLEAEAPDEEILARGFERFSDALLERLTGSYALLVWDRTRQRGLLARDPLGSRPIFLISRGRGLLFASEIQPLLNALPTSPAVDALGLGYWLTRRRTPAELTLYDGLHRLPAGYCVYLSANSHRVYRWWTPRYVEPTPTSRPEAASMLRREMTAAVRRAVGDAHMAGITLSGGFDSGSVAAIAKSISAVDRLRSYSVVFPNRSEADEGELISELRAQLGLEGIERRFDGGSALVAAAQFIAAWSVPPSSPNGFVWRPLITQAAADGNEVVLDGTGGDELFGCSPYLLADLLLRGRLRVLLDTTRRLPGMGLQPDRRLFQRALRLYAVRGALPRRAHVAIRRRRERGRGRPPWLAQHTFEQVVDTEPLYPWKALAGPRWWAALVDALVYMPDSLGAADELRREAILGGAAFAHPWRDPRLVEHMLAQPPELSFDPIHDRWLAREAMRGILPDSIRLSEAKPTFNVLVQGALEGPDAPLAEELVRNPPDELREHLQRDAIPRLLELRGSRTGALAVWRLATAALWLRSRTDNDILSRLAR